MPSASTFLNRQKCWEKFLTYSEKYEQQRGEFCPPSPLVSRGRSVCAPWRSPRACVLRKGQTLGKVQFSHLILAVGPRAKLLRLSASDYICEGPGNKARLRSIAKIA